MKKLIVIVMLVLASCTPKVVDMGVDFNESANQGIGFGTVPSLAGLSARTVSVWFLPDTTVKSGSGFQYLALKIWPSSSYSGFALDVNHSQNGDVAFGENFSVATGLWSTTNPVLTNGVLANITVTYAMNAASDPIIYVNGVSKAITEELTPSGTIPASNSAFNVGANSTGAQELSPDGKIFDVKVYNRILSAEEILDLYNSRCKIVNDYGLVFHATLDGASGLTSFDGATLGAGNIFTDKIGGAKGVPAGNPVGYADNQLSCGGW